MDDIATKLQQKIEDVVSETKQKMDELSARQEALAADLKKKTTAIKRNFNSTLKLIRGNEDVCMTNAKENCEHFREQAETGLFILKSIRLLTQLNKRQVPQSSTEGEQLRAHIEDVDQRSNTLKQRIDDYTAEAEGFTAALAAEKPNDDRS